MAFDWDPEKDAANREKHGIAFDEARHIFDGPVLTRADDRQDYGEQRFISPGHDEVGSLRPKGWRAAHASRAPKRSRRASDPGSESCPHLKDIGHDEVRGSDSASSHRAQGR